MDDLFFNVSGSQYRNNTNNPAYNLKEVKESIIDFLITTTRILDICYLCLSSKSESSMTFDGK